MFVLIFFFYQFIMKKFQKYTSIELLELLKKKKFIYRSKSLCILIIASSS